MVRPYLHREAKPQAIHSTPAGLRTDAQVRSREASQPTGHLGQGQIHYRSAEVVDPSFGFTSSKLSGPDCTFITSK